MKVSKKIKEETLKNENIKNLYKENFIDILNKDIEIDINIDSKEDLYLNYSKDDKINLELFNYIESSYLNRLLFLRSSLPYLKINKDEYKKIDKKKLFSSSPIINLNIKNDVINKEDSKSIKDKVSLYYLLKANEEKNKLKRVYITSFLLLLFGLLILFVYGLFKILFDDFLFNEVILIFSWVPIWTSFENYIFLRSDYKKNIFLYYKLYKSKINIEFKD